MKIAETQQAVEWALQQYIVDEFGEKKYVQNEGKLDRHMLVDFVRQYFNDHNIEYSTFSFEDLKPFLN